MSGNLIKKPQDWHEEAFKFWVKVQNYGQVATHCGKSKAQIQRVANTYKWGEKYLEFKKKDDEILAGQLSMTVGETRKRAIKLLHQMSAWLKDLAFIHETLIKEKREATAEEIAQMTRLQNAIDDFNPKDLRDLTMNLKENVHFDPPKGKVVMPGGEEDQVPLGNVNVMGPTLIIMAPGQKVKQPLTPLPMSKETENGQSQRPV
jgi:hypothetical protein